jgi:polyhydroxybutyrate depolymerase
VTAALLLAALLAPETVSYTVQGVERTALVYAPTRPSQSPPLVYGFHGHGGNSRNAARSFRMHETMPEAVVVYMQGLPTPTPNDPEGRRPGWQIAKGLQRDRDLAFFDAVHADLTKRFKTDPDRVYAMGHSNGARFTYLLWAERGDLFAAFAPSGSPAGRMALSPKPLFHVAGEKDPLFSFANQARTTETVRQTNGCGDGEKTGGHTTLYRGKDGNDVVTYFHPGGHEFPRDVPPLIAEFFRTRSRG